MAQVLELPGDRFEVGGHGGISNREVLELQRVGRVAKNADDGEGIFGYINPAVVAWAGFGGSQWITQTEVDELSKLFRVSNGTILGFFGMRDNGTAYPTDTLPLIVCGLPAKGERPAVPARRFENLRYDETGIGDDATLHYRRYVRGLMALCLCNSAQTQNGYYDDEQEEPDTPGIGYGGLYRSEYAGCRKKRNDEPDIKEMPVHETATLAECLRHIARCTDVVSEAVIDEANQLLCFSWVRIWIEKCEAGALGKWRVRVRYCVPAKGKSDYHRPDFTIPVNDEEGYTYANGG